jgi:hypothetical protein
LNLQNQYSGWHRDGTSNRLLAGRTTPRTPRSTTLRETRLVKGDTVDVELQHGISEGDDGNADHQ